MWLVPARFMCDKHLLGEHLELHMFVGSIKKGISMGGYLDGLLDTSKLLSRHKELVQEMQRRGMRHVSPLSFIPFKKEGWVDVIESFCILSERCPYCRSRMVDITL